MLKIHMLESMLPVDDQQDDTGRNNNNSNSNNHCSSSSNSSSISINSILSVDGGYSNTLSGGLLSRSSSFTSRTSSNNNDNNIAGTGGGGSKMLYSVIPGSNNRYNAVSTIAKCMSMRSSSPTPQTQPPPSISSRYNNAFFGAYTGGGVGGGYQYYTYKQYNHNLQARLHNLTNTAIVTTTSAANSNINNDVNNSSATTATATGGSKGAGRYDDIGYIDDEQEEQTSVLRPANNNNSSLQTPNRKRCNINVNNNVTNISVNPTSVLRSKSFNAPNNSYAISYNASRRYDPRYKYHNPSNNGTNCSTRNDNMSYSDTEQPMLHQYHHHNDNGRNTNNARPVGYDARSYAPVGRGGKGVVPLDGSTGPLGIMLAFTRTLSRRYNTRWECWSKEWEW